MSEYRYVGKWWVPSNADHKVGGVLEIDESGKSRLELTDELIGAADVPVLHGAADGRHITLLDAIRTNGTKRVIGQHSTTVEVIQAETVLVGIALNDGEDVVFDGIEVNISHLTMWANRTGMSTKLVPKEGGKGFTRTIAGFDVLDSLISRVESASAEISLDWILTMTGPRNEAWNRSYHVDERVRLKIVSDHPRSLGGFDDLVQAVQDLVTLGVQSGCAVTDRVLIIRRDGTRDYPVKIFFQAGRLITKDVIRTRDVLFGLDDIEDFGAAIESWLSLREQIGLPLHVLFGLDYEPGGYYENQIFNAASAAEGFHTALCPKTKAISDEDHVAIKAKVDEVFEGVQKAWLKQLIGNNRPGLKTRYMELAELADPEAVGELLGNVDTWAKWLKDARNAIGHLNTDELEKKIPEDARFRLTDITKALLHLILIDRLGIDVAVQRRAVEVPFSYSSREFRAAVEEANL
ncbi:ApeA N-terminal domain 1-containing protein [Rhodococcus sp. NPDC004095]